MDVAVYFCLVGLSAAYNQLHSYDAHESESSLRSSGSPREDVDLEILYVCARLITDRKTPGTFITDHSRFGTFPEAASQTSRSVAGGHGEGNIRKKSLLCSVDEDSPFGTKSPIFLVFSRQHCSCKKTKRLKLCTLVHFEPSRVL